MKYETIVVNGERIRYLRFGKGPQILFMHGFGIGPKPYRELLELLAKDHEVIAPSLYGMNYLRRQPTTFDEYTRLTRTLIHKLKLKPTAAVGHSMGGTVALRLPYRAIAVNPALPSSIGAFGFLPRALWKQLRAMGGTGGKRGVLFALGRFTHFTYTVMRKPLATMRSFDEISHLSAEGFSRSDAVILYGIKDEFFGVHGCDGLRCRVKKLPFSHDWIVFYPERAAKEIGKELKR